MWQLERISRRPLAVSVIHLTGVCHPFLPTHGPPHFPLLLENFNICGGSFSIHINRMFCSTLCKSRLSGHLVRAVPRLSRVA